jgi:hypothetical protein
MDGWMDGWKLRNLIGNAILTLLPDTVKEGLSEHLHQLITKDP